VTGHAGGKISACCLVVEQNSVKFHFFHPENYSLWPFTKSILMGKICLALSRLSATPRCIGLSSLQQPQSLLLFKQTVDGLIFPPFDTLLVSILFSNLSRLVLLNILC